MKDLADEFMQSLLSLDRLSAKRILADSDNRMSSLKLIDKVVVDALERIGVGWGKWDNRLIAGLHERTDL